MNLQKEKLADAVKKHPSLLNFLDRLGIKLGFGDASIDEVCRNNTIPIPFFIELMQLIIKRYEFNPNYIKEFEPKLTVSYLENSHKSFINDYLNDFEIIINELSHLEIERHQECLLLERYFKIYRSEFEEHLQYEDNIIFPYILALESSIVSNNYDYTIFDKIQNNPITNYMKNHSSLDDKLNDLKSLIIMFFKPFRAEKLVRKLLKLMFELDEDLKLHELIENKILFPQAKQMEEKILQQIIEINRKL